MINRPKMIPPEMIVKVIRMLSQNDVLINVVTIGDNNVTENDNDVAEYENNGTKNIKQRY